MNNQYNNSELTPILPIEPSSDENERIREKIKAKAFEEEYKATLEEFNQPKEGLHFHRCSNCGEYECPDDAACYSPEKQDCYECRNN